MPPLRGEAPPVVFPGLEQKRAHPQRSQQRQPRESAAAAASEHPEAEVVTDLACGGTGGDASKLAEPQGSKESRSAAGGVAGANEGTTGDRDRRPAPRVPFARLRPGHPNLFSMYDADVCFALSMVAFSV